MTKAVIDVDEFEVAKETKKDLQVSFSPFFEEAKQYEQEALSLVVTSEDQTEDMEKAREMRLKLKKIRVETEKKRKEMKSESLRKGKAIDGIANVIKYLIVPLEEHLKKQEDYIKLIEEAKLDKIEEKRKAILESYEEGLSDLHNVRDMEQETFDLLVEKYERAKQAQIEAEKQAEEERRAKEKAEAEERKRIEEENKRLKREAKERAEKEEAERKKREREEKKRMAELEKERKEKEKLEREKREREEREEAERKAKEKAEKEKRLAPDKRKLEDFAVKIANIEFPEVKSKEAVAVLKKANSMLLDVSEYVKDKSIGL